MEANNTKKVVSMGKVCKRCNRKIKLIKKYQLINEKWTECWRMSVCECWTVLMYGNGIAKVFNISKEKAKDIVAPCVQ